MLRIEIPGRGRIQAEHLVLDVNGTLTVDGRLVPGVAERIAQLKEHLHVLLLTADTFGTAEEVGKTLGVAAVVLCSQGIGMQKRRQVQALNGSSVIAIGNGANDAGMLKAAALGLVVANTEGVAVAALREADALFPSIGDALDALLHPERLVATLRE